MRKTTPTANEIENLNEQVSSLFRSYDSLCRDENIRLMVVLRPDKAEIMRNKYDYDFTPIFASMKNEKQLKVIDLLPCYHSYLEKSHTSTDSYFWVQDGHHNSKGYAMMAHCIYQNVAPLLRDTNLTK